MPGFQGLEDSVESLEAGNLETEIAISGSEEIRHLGKSVQSMYCQIILCVCKLISDRYNTFSTDADAKQPCQ